MSIAGSLRDLVPESALRLARAARRYWRRVGYWRSRLTPSRVITVQDIQRALRELGVRDGDDILLHSSMRAFGAIDGGSDALLQGLLQVIGSGGTLLVPTYPGTGSSYAHLTSGGIVLDAVKSPSRMGKITEAVRLSPGALRSLHPTHAIAALGPSAHDYVDRHHHSVTPCGPGSPFEKLIDRKGWVACVGSPIGRVTSYHVVEDRVADFPVEVYAPGVHTVMVSDLSGAIVQVQARAHNPEVAPLRIDNNERKEAEFQVLLTQMGVLRQRRVGAGTISVMRADLLEEALEQLLQRGITIYGTEPAG